MRNDKEKNRKLTPAEERRLEQFNNISSRLENEGYSRRELTVGIVKANVFAFILAIPVCVIGFVLFFLHNHGRDSFRIILSLPQCAVFVAAMIILIPVHELIHGLTWGLFTENHMRDIEYGFMKEYMTPYCTCREPLSLFHYITGGLMPLLILGIIPTVAGILSGSLLTLVIGLVMILSAAGDIMICARLLGFKSDADEVLIYDHPTQAGSVIFERRM